MNSDHRLSRAAALISLVSALFLICIATAKAGGVEIIAHPKSGKGPMWVRVEPRVNNLREPLKFCWYFGDGQESKDAVPKPHFYDFGKYNLLLEVTDKNGKTYTASIVIDAALPG